MAHGVFECDAVLDVIEWKDEYDGVLTDCAEFDKFEDMGILDHNDYDFDVSQKSRIQFITALHRSSSVASSSNECPTKYLHMSVSPL